MKEKLLSAVSVVLLGRSFFALYVQRCGTRASKILTWTSAAFVLGVWTLQAIR